MAKYKANIKNLIIYHDKLIKFNGGFYETTDKAQIKTLADYSKRFPEIGLKEIKDGE